jgi:hypothetical protein
VRTYVLSFDFTTNRVVAYAAQVVEASDTSTVPTANKIPVADASGQIAAGWIPAGAGGSTVAYVRTLGWYTEYTLVVGNGIGPIYKLDGPVTLLGFDANAKVAPTSTCTLDVQTSPDYSTWTSIFSTKPTIASGAALASGGVLATTSCAAGVYIRWCVIADGAAASVTAQLRMQSA